MVLFGILEKLCTKYKQIIVIGDFNLYSCPINVRSYYEYFLSFCEFTQNSNVSNCLNRQLDLVLSTGLSEVSVVRADGSLVPVDAHHPPLAPWRRACGSRVRAHRAPPTLAPAAQAFLGNRVGIF